MAAEGSTALDAVSVEDQTLLVFARLMEGGKEDDETCRELDRLSRLLNDDAEAQLRLGPEHRSICAVIDGDCVDTLLCYLDMRQPHVVRAHATVATSAYLKAARQHGSKMLSAFFFDRIRRGTYDDYIVAFCVASATFPIAPDLTAELFLSEGFLASLGPLMRREWKSRKVETACLEMLNAACMNPLCREPVERYCVGWLEEVVDQDPSSNALASGPQGDDGSISMRRHSVQVQHLAAVILAKLRAFPTKPPPAATTADSSAPNQPRVEPAAVTSIEDLSDMFAKTILNDQDSEGQHSIEGLAYASLQPKVKESVAANKTLLAKLVKALADAPPKSPATYGALSIFVNLTRYRPVQTEEEAKMGQLKAYANAAGKLPGPDPLDDDEHVANRCQAVFDSGVIPVLVTHSKAASPASLGLVVSIIHSISVNKSLRGRLAQQGVVKLLLTAWAALPSSEDIARRMAAQALARILISINPALVFGGNRPNPVDAAIRPLASIIPPDPASDRRDLLPTFEALMALTNLASLEEVGTRRAIIQAAWPHLEEQLLSSNVLVSRAAVELICNLVQSDDGIAMFSDGSQQAKNRLHILLALADAEDQGTRSAAGGALAALTANPSVVSAICQRDRGIDVILAMCNELDEGLCHRGIVSVYNMASATGAAGETARQKLVEKRAVAVLKEGLKQSRQPEVLRVFAEALKALLPAELVTAP